MVFAYIHMNQWISLILMKEAFKHASNQAGGFHQVI